MLLCVGETFNWLELITHTKCTSLNCSALYLFYDERRDTLWNIAWPWGKSRGRMPRDFPRAQAILHSISRLKSQYRHSHLAYNRPALAVAYAEVTAVSGKVYCYSCKIDCFSLCVSKCDPFLINIVKCFAAGGDCLIHQSSPVPKFEQQTCRARYTGSLRVDLRQRKGPLDGAVVF